MMTAGESARAKDARRTAVDGGRISSLSARSTVPVARDLDSRLARYLSKETRLRDSRYDF